MLSLIPCELREQMGLGDPESPVLNIVIDVMEEGGIFVTLDPSEDVGGPFSTIIATRIQEGKAQPGRYSFQVQMFEQTRITANDQDAARQVLNLFRHDLPAIFDALDEVTGHLVKPAKLQELIDKAVFTLMQQNLSQGLVVDPRELRAVAVCPTCAPRASEVRNLGIGDQIEQAVQNALSKAPDFTDGEGLMACIHRITRAPSPKPNEFFISGPVPHDHPFYTLSVLLGETAGNIMVQQRAPVIAREFVKTMMGTIQQLEILQKERGTHC